MSVKITRNEEKRNTSLMNFLLVATLPLLLFGAIGFLIGSNRSGDAEKNAAELAKIRAKYDKLALESASLDAYLIETDSLRKELLEELEALGKSRISAFTQEPTALGDDPVGDWWREVNQVQNEYQRKLKGLQGQMEGEKILSRQQIAIPVDLFTDFNEKAHENFKTFKDARERYGINKNEYAKKLEETDDDHKDEISQLKNKLERCNDEVDDLDRDKERLTEQLASTGKVICPDNAPEKSAIKDAISKIIAEVEALEAKRGILNMNKETREQIREVQIEVQKLGQEIRDNASEVQ